MNIALDIDGILANADFAFRSMMPNYFNYKKAYLDKK